MKKLDWHIISDEHDLQAIRENSESRPQVIYKHSTHCFISSIVRKRLENTPVTGEIDFHFLDLIRHRSISNKIAADFNISHESPQILVIRNGVCIYDASHDNIQMDDLSRFAA